MEEKISGKGDFQVNSTRPNSILSPMSSKASILPKSSPRNSPTLRKLGSNRIVRKDSRGSVGRFVYNRVVFWLVLIAIWAYIGFYVQSQWAHGDHETVGFLSHQKRRSAVKAIKGLGVKFGVKLARKGRKVSSKNIGEMNERMVVSSNSSYGLVLGPFGKIEDSVLGWRPEKRRGSCNRRSDFGYIVLSRRFVMVFHEVSMRGGASVPMLELASEILSCGGSVSAVVLDRQGGPMGELKRRGVRVLQDNGMPSFKVAKRVDLVIAGSAACSSWIEPYLDHYPAGAGQIVWWIMENRRDYFDRSKHLINRVKVLAFLSASQSKQWLSWCEEENIKFFFQPMIVPLYVKEELAFVAGINCSLNTPAFSVERMIETRDLLRSAVRKEMGLGVNDMLVMSLSSMKPAKGQSLLLEAALLVVKHKVSLKNPKSFELLEENILSGIDYLNLTVNTGRLNAETDQNDKLEDGIHKNSSTRASSKKRKRKHHIKTVTDEVQGKSRNLLSAASQQKATFKVLIGSIGSHSNDESYVKEILSFLTQHSDLSKVVFWTPETTRLAALYAAADVYVVNTQGLGEAFGRETIEAMAFGIPVLGTDAGGTREIVDHRVTGLLHHIGHEGTKMLAQHLQYLLHNPTARKKMGMNGRRKAQEKYLKGNTYNVFAKILSKCLKHR